MQIKREENERRINAKNDPRQLADAYSKRAEDVDRQRKIRRSTQKKD